MKLPRTHRSHIGFTLPELLVIVVILGLLAALAAPSFLSWVNNKRVQDVLSQVEGAIKEAQSEAIRKSQPCKLIITTSSVSADPQNCLPTGSRDLTEVSGGDSGAGVTFTAANSSSVLFSAKGTTTSSNVFVLYHPDQSQGMQCLAISAGVGIIRTGEFKGPHIPSSSDATSTNCYTSS